MYFIFGTDQGRIFCFPFYFSHNLKFYQYQIYKINYEEITFLYAKRNFLLACTKHTRFFAFELFQNEEALNKEEENSISNSSQSETDSLIIELDLSRLKKFESELEIPVKKILKIKILKSLEEDANLEDLPEDMKQFTEQNVAILLQNNTLLIFSTQSWKIEFEFKSNEGEVTGVYLHPFLDELLITKSIGRIEIWSLVSGTFERSVKFYEYIHLFALKTTISEHQSSKLFHDYKKFKENFSKTISKFHQPLEYNQRYEQSLLNYIWKRNNNKLKTNYYQINCERLGDLTIYQNKIEAIEDNQQNLDTDAISSELLEIFDYSNDLIVESKDLLQAFAFLRFFTEKNQFNKNSLNQQSDHVLFINCLLNNQNIKSIMRETKSRNSNLSYIILILNQLRKANPQLYKLQMQITNNLIPVFDMKIGIQGCGETFTFCFNNQEMINNSNYCLTQLVLATVLYFFTYQKNSQQNYYQEFLSIIFQNDKSKILKLNNYLLAKYFLDENPEVLHSAFSLLTYSFKQTQNFNSIQSFILPFYEENQRQLSLIKSIDIGKIEAIWLIFLGYAGINIKEQQQLTPIVIERTFQIINVKSCIQQPNLSAALIKYFIDSQKYWKNQMKDVHSYLKIFSLLHFNYFVASNPENRLQLPKLQFTEIENQSAIIIKKMKSLSAKATIIIGQIFMDIFKTFLQTEITNQSSHYLYPISLLEIIRQFLLKEERSIVLTNLQNFIEIILKTLDPNNPQLRKICHKQSTNALWTIFKTFDEVCFHQQSQKYAIGSKEGPILIYDLRTSVQ